MQEPRRNRKHCGKQLTENQDSSTSRIQRVESMQTKKKYLRDSYVKCVETLIIDYFALWIQYIDIILSHEFFFGH